MAVLIAIAPLLASPAARGQGRGASTEISQSGFYEVVHGWPELPRGELLGAVAGVGVSPRGDVFVFRRAGRAWPGSDELDTSAIARPTVLVFDGPTGKLRASWGAHQFAMPHGLTVDSDGNVWLTDVALQQVYKYSADGRRLLVLGERGVAGDDSAHFNRPTQVAVARDGSFYVSDGYRNTRVMKFARDGRFLFQWGTKGSGPGQFDLPHGVALDSRGRVYVADRSNSRVQIFDERGHYLSEWKSTALGRPYAIALGANGIAFVADGGDQPAAPPDRSAMVVVRLDGAVIASIGRYGNYDGQFAMAHSIAVGPDGAVYVGDITGGRVQKFVARRRKTDSKP